jgi:8-oxo-dGTP diphosphatase
MKIKENMPKVGLTVIIKKNGKILLGKRKGSHDSGTWCFPGGHLEFMENLEQCAKRETKEETGMEIDNIKFLTLTNDFFIKENKHYITIFMTAEIEENQEPKIMEPDKCDRWDFFYTNDMPSPLFSPIKNLLKQNPEILK